MGATNERSQPRHDEVQRAIKHERQRNADHGGMTSVSAVGLHVVDAVNKKMILSASPARGIMNTNRAACTRQTSTGTGRHHRLNV